MPAMPHASASSPNRAAYVRIDVSTARACLRRLSLRVNSVRIAQAPLRSTTTWGTVAGLATCRSTFSRTSSSRSLRDRGCGADSRAVSGSTRPSRDTSTPPARSSRLWASLDLLLLSGLAQRLHFGFQLPQALDEILDRFRHRVGKIGLVQIDLTGDPLAVAICYAARHADHNGVGGNLADHDRAGADAAARADRESADDRGPSAHHDV